MEHFETHFNIFSAKSIFCIVSSILCPIVQSVYTLQIGYAVVGQVANTTVYLLECLGVMNTNTFGN